MRGRSVRDRRRGWSRLTGRDGVHLGWSHTHAPCPSARRGGALRRLCAESPRPVGRGPPLARLWGRDPPALAVSIPGLASWLAPPSSASALSWLPKSRGSAELSASCSPGRGLAAFVPRLGGHEPVWGAARAPAALCPECTDRRLLESPAPGPQGPGVWPWRRQAVRGGSPAGPGLDPFAGESWPFLSPSRPSAGCQVADRPGCVLGGSRPFSVGPCAALPLQGQEKGCGGGGPGEASRTGGGSSAQK